MKKFRIRYTILDGEFEYLDELVVAADSLSQDEALSWILHSFTCAEDLDDFNVDEFVRAYSRDGWTILPDDRGIRKIAFEEVQPILFVVNDHGVRCQTWPLPDDVIIRIEHYDADGCHLGTETWGQ